MRRPLNLARQPFRNERLPTLVLLIGCVLLLGLSVRHAMAARDLLPERTAGVDGELGALEQEVARLRSEAGSLSGRSASEQSLREWAVIRDLVDRRAFSWSELLGRLEGVVPAGIRLVSIAPAGAEGEIEVAVSAVGEAVEDGLDFLQALQEGEAFKEPFLSSVSEGADGIDFAFTMIYVPGSRASEGDTEDVASGEGREPVAGEEEPSSTVFDEDFDEALDEDPEDEALDEELDPASPGGVQ